MVDNLRVVFGNGHFWNHLATIGQGEKALSVADFVGRQTPQPAKYNLSLLAGMRDFRL